MTDSFDPAAARTPAEVRQVTITLSVTESDPPGGAHGYAAGYYFEVLDPDGEPMAVRQGNLVPHLTATQRTQLMAFMDAMLAKAQGTVP